MPTYEFRCGTCGETVEVKRSIENRNRPPGRCLEVRGLDEESCEGKYLRLWAPVQFRINNEDR